jgi:hypothetical protein
MAQMRSRGFLGTDELDLDDVGANILRMVVLEGVELDAYVQTFEYKYNAFIRGHNNILRYDNTHMYPGHGDAHHRHKYDWRTGKELSGSPEWVGEHRWPTLGEVLEEIERWYWENRDYMPNPDKYPELGVRG